MDPSLSWQGYVDDSGQATPVSMASYYDCDGTRGVRALLLDQSATWCPDCEQQAAHIGPEMTSTWSALGVQVVTLVSEDQSHDPATLATALSWRNEYALTKGAVCADPGWTTKLWGGASSAGNGLPTNVLVDPRTMRIVAIQPADLDGTVQNLAAGNR